MDRKILFGCFLLSLVGCGYGLFMMQGSISFKTDDFFYKWFLFSLPLIVYYAYLKTFKSGE